MNDHAVRAVVRILFATGRAYTLETLREKLREFFLWEGDYEKRAAAALSTVQLITAILEAAPTRKLAACKSGLPTAQLKRGVGREEARWDEAVEALNKSASEVWERFCAFVRQGRESLKIEVG